MTENTAQNHNSTCNLACRWSLKTSLINGVGLSPPPFDLCFFFFAKMLKEIVTRHNPSIHMGQIGQSDLPRRSAKSGTEPSTPACACGKSVGATRELAKDLPRETASIRVHLPPGEENGPLEERRSFPCRAAATNSTAWEIHLPPVSMAITTRRHLSSESSSAVHSCSGAHNAVHSSSSRARHPRRGLTPRLPRLFRHKLAQQCSCRPTLRCIEQSCLLPGKL